MPNRSTICAAFYLTILMSALGGRLFAPTAAGAQDAAVQATEPTQSPKPAVEISAEPKTIDPATLVPEYLAQPVTVNFDESTLREVGEWIQENQQIPVLFDKTALNDEGVILGEQVTDHLQNAPLYLLLNRLSSLGLAWYVEDRIVHITTQVKGEEHLTTIPYNVADLLDAGYDTVRLTQVIQSATSGPWFDIEGTGGELQWLGDVQFIRQNDKVHREIAGILAGLRQHGRRTFVLDPPQHQRLREKLEQNVDVNFREQPLVRAVAQLAEKSGADIRIDSQSLREDGIRDREPVSLVLTERKLGTVLQVLLSNLGLTWVLRDGVMWIMTEVDAEDLMKTAIYDVRDLCRDDQESAALTEAIQHQTSGPWLDVEGTGGTITFAKSGTMVVRHTERGLDEVLSLLETYRKALSTSKPRNRDQIDMHEVVTQYYRMSTGTADDLKNLLPVLITADNWKINARPDGIGTIIKVTSTPEVLNLPGKSTNATSDASASGPVVSQSVLVIQQTREIHEKIAGVIKRVNHGDMPAMLGLGEGDMGSGGLGGGGSFGGGGGSFGSGFFSVPTAR